MSCIRGMNKYYLLSGMDEKNDYNFYPNIICELKKDLHDGMSIVYVSGNPYDKKSSLKRINSNIFSNYDIHFYKRPMLYFFMVAIP